MALDFVEEKINSLDWLPIFGPYMGELGGFLSSVRSFITGGAPDVVTDIGLAVESLIPKLPWWMPEWAVQATVGLLKSIEEALKESKAAPSP